MRLQLAIALYHQEEFADASVELETAAQTLGEDRAEIALYRGLILLAQAQPESAAAGAAWLERARTLGGETVEPVASYYAGVGWSTAQDRERARAALTRVVDEWPGTSWATQAQRRLDELGADDIRWWGTLRAGIEYDSNAVLQGQGVPLPSEISSQRDCAASGPASSAPSCSATSEWAAGAALNYAGTAYRDVTSFDTQYPGLAVWLDRSLDDATTLRFAADGGYAWVDERSLLHHPARQPLAAAPVGHGGIVRVLRPRLARQLPADQRRRAGRTGRPGAPCVPPPDSIAFCGPPGLDEHAARNRDGNGTSIGVLHTLPIPIELPYGGDDGALRLPVRPLHRARHRVHLSGPLDRGRRARRAAVAAARSTSPGSFTWRPFRHATTFPNEPLYYDEEYALPHEPAARDLVHRSTWCSSVPSTSGSRRRRAGIYEATDSTAQVFDYDRQIVGAYLTATFGN